MPYRRVEWHVCIFTGSPVLTCGSVYSSLVPKEKKIHLLNERLKKTIVQFKNGDEKKVSEQ